MILNEPETSLHPDLLPPLARLIAQASRQSQITSCRPPVAPATSLDRIVLAARIVHVGIVSPKFPELSSPSGNG